MENLLNRLNQYKTCLRCGLLKEQSDFLTGHDENKKAIYGDICYACRQANPEEEGSLFGKKHTLALNSDTLQFLQDLLAEENAQYQDLLEQGDLEKQALQEKQTEEEKNKTHQEEKQATAIDESSDKQSNKQQAVKTLASLFNERTQKETAQNVTGQNQQETIQNSITNSQQDTQQKETTTKSIGADETKKGSERALVTNTGRKDFVDQQNRAAKIFQKKSSPTTTGKLFSQQETAKSQANENNNTTPTLTNKLTRR